MNVTQSLFFCKNIIYSEWKYFEDLLKYIGPKSLWNLSHHTGIHLENIANTSCYLAKIPVDFRFICLSLFCRGAVLKTKCFKDLCPFPEDDDNMGAC